MQSERDRLVEEIGRKLEDLNHNQILDVARFIIQDRKRIVSIIIKFKGTNEAIDETLRRAGVE